MGTLWKRPLPDHGLGCLLRGGDYGAEWQGYFPGESGRWFPELPEDRLHLAVGV